MMASLPSDESRVSVASSSPEDFLPSSILGLVMLYRLGFVRIDCLRLPIKIEVIVFRYDRVANGLFVLGTNGFVVHE